MREFDAGCSDFIVAMHPEKLPVAGSVGIVVKLAWEDKC